MEFDLRWMQNYGCRSHVTISCKYVCMSVVTSCCVVQVVSHHTSARNLRNGISAQMNVCHSKRKGVALSHVGSFCDFLLFKIMAGKHDV
jgi:hypothetical protein